MHCKIGGADIVHCLYSYILSMYYSHVYAHDHALFVSALTLSKKNMD